ncbi:MAG: helix-turn-helix domain-containing protein [Proteobacteria bacterium]|nr:helix-turn-helix domain-containing protein [Pseudomonadota bacterium]
MNIPRFHNPQIIKEGGKPAFAVLPYDEYEALLEIFDELSDEHDYKIAINTETEDIPAYVVDKLLSGENPLRVWREYRALTQQEIAQAVGISIPFLSQIETDKRLPSLRIYQKLAKVLNVSLDNLVIQEQTSEGE